MEHQQVRLHEHELLQHQEINSSTLKKKDGWKANPASPTTTKKIYVFTKNYSLSMEFESSKIGDYYFNSL